MLGSQSTAGDRNEVWDLERPRSPKSLGAVEWIDDPPRPGGRPERLGYTQVFRVPPSGPPPPSRATCPSPGAASESRSTPTPRREIGAPLHLPAPTSPGGPQRWGWGGGGGCGPGEGGADSPEPRPPPPQPARPPPAAVPARLLPPLLAQVRRSSPAPRLPLNLRLESRDRALLGGRRERSPDRSVRDPVRVQRIRRSGARTFCSPRIQGCQPTAPLLSNRAAREPSHRRSQDPGSGAPAPLHSQI